MKFYLTLATATLSLAACGQKAETTAEATPMSSETVVATPVETTGAATGSMAGTYEVTMGDGSTMTQTINADNTYTDVMDGRETTGTWRMDGQRSCFDPEGSAAEECYTTSAVAADGSFTATSADGTTTKVRKVAAAPGT